MDKLLSIIVPSYNMENYLQKCLGSLLVDDAKLLQQLDVIVVNDGSKDRTSEIGHEFERRHPGVFRVIDKPNGNYGSCINAALPVALGRFVKILDADDTYDTNSLSTYLQILGTMGSHSDMVMSDYVQVDELGNETARISYALPTESEFGVGDLVSHHCPMAMHAVAFRTAMLREMGYRQTEGISYTDTEWIYLPPINARSIRYVHLPVYRYLIGRSGQTMEASTWEKNIWMVEKIFQTMISQYEIGKFDAAGKSYLEFQLLRLFPSIHNFYLDRAVGSELTAYFKRLHKAVKTCPCLVPTIRQPLIFVRLPVRFHYVDFMVRHPTLANPTLSFVRRYAAWRKHK